MRVKFAEEKKREIPEEKKHILHTKKGSTEEGMREGESKARKGEKA